MSQTELAIDKLNWSVNETAILTDISFSVAKRESVAILGPNGAGKTSLLKCIYQALAPTSGHVFLHGRDLTTLTVKQVSQYVAVVTQHHNPAFDLTVYDVVHMGLIPNKGLFEFDTSKDKNQIQLALTKVDLVNKQDQLFSTLSGGEQQRCLIARAIVQTPSVLIMDEPTNHLDVYYQHQILSLVNKLDITVLMTIHDLNLAAHYCDKIVLMNQGKLAAFDTPERVLTPQALEPVFRLPCQVDSHPLTNNIRVTFGAPNEN